MAGSTPAAQRLVRTSAAPAALRPPSFGQPSGGAMYVNRVARGGPHDMTARARRPSILLRQHPLIALAVLSALMMDAAAPDKAKQG